MATGLMKNSDLAIKRGLDFLAGQQQSDGSFLCLVSKKLDDYKHSDTVPAIVPTNIVLSSLIHIKDVASEDIKKKAAKFLLKEKGEYWSFNYWFRKSDWYKKEPYPDDTDDTFVPLAALYEYNPKVFTAKAMAKIVTMLTSCEKQEGGPYDMWLVPPDARDKWNDTDLVCNANIAYFLSLQDIYLPKVTAFIEKKIESNRYEFPYNKIYPAIYFISRSYPPPHKATEGQGRDEKSEKMIRLLLKHQKKDGKWENPLRTALAISSLINFSGNAHAKNIEKGIAYLIKTQKSDGSWPASSFYWQCRLPDRTLYAGSASITTALCLEALNKCLLLRHNDEKLPKVSGELSEDAEKIYQTVVIAAKKRFAHCGADVKREAEKIILKTAKDRHIILLPYYFAKSLRNSKALMRTDLMARLGQANLFGWMAYTIYDDFLDQEGEPKLLSVANICLRESADIFNNVVPVTSGFYEFAKDIFDIIDSANAWEVSRCRDIKNPPDYGDYSRLAEKSLGHALGPAAALFALGYKKDSLQVRHTMQWMRHYIIARQLNDDAHDWQEDFKNGHINAAAALLLQDAGKSANTEKLQRIFWEKTIVKVCKTMAQHIRLARREAKQSAVFSDMKLVEQLLLPIETSAQKALQERKETLQFIGAYKPR